MKQPLAITGTSAITAVGADVEQTCAAIRAGVSRLTRHAFAALADAEPGWVGDEDPLIAAAVPGIDPFLGAPDRLFALLLPVLADLVERARLMRRDLGGTALLISLPAADPVVARWSLSDAFLPELARRSGLAFEHTRLSQAGHAGMIALLAEASALLESGAVQACIVAGVESHLILERVAYLDQAARLRNARNVDGFFPGEAAAALLVELPRRGRGRPALATITALGLGSEPATMSGDRASTGRGLTEALRAVMPPASRGEWVLCDLNGESYRAFEWGVARARLGERLGGLRRLVHPATSVGDVGAATGGILLASATAAFQRGYAAADEAVLWTSSDGGTRAAARVARAPGDPR